MNDRQHTQAEGAGEDPARGKQKTRRPGGARQPAAEAAARVCERAASLRAERDRFTGVWQDIADYVMPRKNDVATQGSPRIRTAFLSDVTALDANEKLGAGQLAYVCPANEVWFKIQSSVAQENPEVSEFFERASQTVFRRLAASNFYLEAHECFLDRGAFGTMCCYLQAGEGGALVFRSVPCGTFMIDEDCDGMVDTVYREFKLTARQAAQQFGAERLHPDMKKLLGARDPAAAARKWDFIHAVEPRTLANRNPMRKDNRSKPYASYWVDAQNRHVVRESGYDEMPYFVSRFLKTNFESYGYSPAWTALPVVKQLNKIEDDLDVLGEKAANPPILAPFDGAFTVDSRAGGITYYDPVNKAVPQEWQTAGRYDVGRDRAEVKRQQINSIFFVDMFQMMSTLDKQMTAREVAERSAEKLVLFSPTFARLTTEFFTPLLTRVFAMMARNGEFGPAPAALDNGDGNWVLDMRVEYVSKIAMAIKSLETRAWAQFAEIMLPLVQIDNAILDHVDFDAVTQGLAQNLSLPARFLRPRGEVDKIRAERARAEQAGRQMAMLQQGADAMGKLPPELLRGAAQ